jgi:hypothetical protein
MLDIFWGRSLMSARQATLVNIDSEPLHAGAPVTHARPAERLRQRCLAGGGIKDDLTVSSRPNLALRSRRNATALHGLKWITHAPPDFQAVVAKS